MVAEFSSPGDTLLSWALMRWAGAVVLAALIGGTPTISHAVNCAEKFSVGRYALARKDAVPLAGRATGLAPVYILKKPLEMKPVGSEDPCEYVYGFDVFEFADEKQPGALVAGCAGDFDGDGVRDYVVLLRRAADGALLAHAFVARGDSFQMFELGRADGSGWTGPSCTARPPSGIFEYLEDGKLRVSGDLVTVGWYTYYWRPDLKRFDAILTSD